MSVAIVWFRRDLRLADNPALRAAIDSGATILPVYVNAPDEDKRFAPGAASRWWLHRSLVALDASLRRRGNRLHVARGESLDVLERLVARTDARALYWNRCYEPAASKRDAAVEKALLAAGLEVHTSNAALLFEPWQIETGQGGPYKVFTPYWRKARAQLEPRPPLPAPRRIRAARASGGCSIDDLALLPTRDWADAFDAHWQPGELGAAKRLRGFVKRALADYATDRDRPDRDGTSRLSPHLHFGELSPMQIAWSLHEAASASRSSKLHGAAETFLREIGWREFSYHLLHHFPATPTTNINPRFDDFAWARKNGAAIGRWQRGRTGIPIVDAGMRQLWTSGWMHNRVRMLVASFLTKNLRQHWLIGARWFWDTLVDADLANNTQGWQWTAGTGADAAPYFRIFNPITQGERFDPDGVYVRRWVPELRGFEGKSIHRPWLDAERRKRARYPLPMVDLGESRTSALAVYRQTAAG